ncbi:MAG: restriction endonuclease subunit S [Nitrospira sp.]|nr:restriction endonuclease subunit S [Nitrospira sp.]
MKLETFFEKFDQFADAPDAVAKMRSLILRLAMQGKLSEPHKADDPVSELLRDVEKDKTRLGLESSAKATNGTSSILGDEPEDVVPARWTWVRFGNIARHNAGKTLDKGRNRGDLRDYITTSNLYWGFFQLNAVRQMPILDDELERCTAIKGDLLICEGGEAGRAAVWPHDRDISFQNHVHRARFFAGINPYFVQRYLEKLNATGEIEKYRKGVGISNMSGKALASIPIPLPPLAEQKRIVAKVDELMALCDRLEGQQQERETRHAVLVRAALARFADAPTPANLDLFSHKSYSIPPADLRKTILTLAVQGKLVPQDPNDEPAECALRICGVDMKRWDVTKEEERQDVPSSWTWIRFAGVGEQRLGKMLDAQKNRGELKPYLRNTNVQWMRFGLDDVKEMRVEEREEEELRLKHGDLLICEGGEPGRCAIWRDEVPEMYFQKALHRIRPCNAVLSELLALNLQIDCQNGVLANYFTGATIKHLTGRSLSSYPIPIPPLAEQRRIVAKVDQLMVLVDQLEIQLAHSRDTAEKLMEAVVTELTAH